MKKLKLVVFLLILLASVIVRLYGFSNPLADWHSWRQADTSSVSRNFVKNGYDILRPRFDDISNVPSGNDNPQGYRFVEFPIYNIIQARLYQVYNIYTLEQWGRLVTIFSSLISVLLIYLIVKKYSDFTTAIFASVFYAFIPFNIYFGRVILPDPSMVAASLSGIYFFDKWLTPRIVNKSSAWLWFILSVLSTALALLLKPYAIFFTIPMIYLVFYRLRFKFYKKWQLYLYLIIALAPLLFWRIWMTQYPEGIPVSDWLFNNGGIRFKGAFFYWLFAERIGKLILGYWGLIIFGAGILNISRKKNLLKNFFFLSFLLSALLYLTVMAGGNVQHDYYQILIMPAIAVFMGLGSSFLLNLPKEYFHQSAGKLLFFVSTVFSLIFGWYYIRDFYNLNQVMVQAGRSIDKILPNDAKVIAIAHGSEGDTTFLYHINRPGWTSFQNPLPELAKKGAQYLIFLSPTMDDRAYAGSYGVYASSEDYIIFDLQKK
jgi:hypothetical protein